MVMRQVVTSCPEVYLPEYKVPTHAWTSRYSFNLKAGDRMLAARQFAEQACYLAIAYYRNYREKYRGAGLGGDIVLLTMGKVGSMTLLNSLRSAISIHNMRVDKAHCISKEGVSYYRRIFDAGYSGWNELPGRTKMLISRRKVQAGQLRKGIGSGRKYKFIILIRDPVATNVSGFFHNYAWWPDRLQKKCREDAGACLDELRQQFMEKYPHDIPLTWFDMELTGNFQVDFLAREFPRSRGYEIYQAGGSDIMILKLELINDCIDVAMREFLGLQDFRLLNRNEAKDKWYYQAYRKFVDSVDLPGEYLDRMYDTRWYRHFYGDEELDRFRARWGTGKLHG